MKAPKLGITNLEQQGVRKKWTTDRKRVANAGRDWIKTHDPKNRKEMLYYAKAGKLPESKLPGSRDGVVDPPKLRWEGETDGWLNMYGLMRAFEVQANGLETGTFDAQRAHDAFVAEYTASLVNLNSAYLFPIRFKRQIEEWGIENKNPLLFCAFGMLIGRREEATTMARLYLAMFRYGFFRHLGYHPVYLLVLRLLADYLGEPMPPVFGRALAYPTYMQLTEVWRTPDPQALVPVCLVTCDLHTHHCYRQPDTWSGDFDNLDWAYTPIEILLLFKLRQWLGLDNPALDHPLMNTVLGKLPEESWHEPSELVASLRARMVREGYDEAAIIRRILTDEFADARPEGFTA